MAEETKTSDTELRKKIKDVEKKKRSKTLKKADSVKVVTAEDNDKRVSFEQYWMMVNKKAGLKPWMKEILWVDFKARGLGKLETEDKYNHALKLFGIEL